MTTTVRSNTHDKNQGFQCLFLKMNELRGTIFQWNKVGWLAGFHGKSTLLGYLMPNPVYEYIKYIWFVNSLLITFLNKPNIISLHTVKWYRVFLFKKNISILELIIFLHTVKWFQVLLTLIIININIGGSRGVMVIVVGNAHGNTSSNPRRDWLHFT